MFGYLKLLYEKENKLNLLSILVPQIIQSIRHLNLVPLISLARTIMLYGVLMFKRRRKNTKQFLSQKR